MLEGWKNLRPRDGFLEPGKDRYPVSSFFFQEFILFQAKKQGYCSLLDIGCGSGTLFSGREAAFMRSFEKISGVDLSVNLIEQAHKRFPFLETYVGDVEHFLIECANSRQYFDIAVMSHVIEMLDSPIEVLSRLKSVSKVLFIEFFLPPPSTEDGMETVSEVLSFLEEEGGGQYVRTHYSRTDYLIILGLSGWELEAEYNSGSGWSIHKLAATTV